MMSVSLAKVVAVCCLAAVAIEAPAATVWSGYDLSFSKPDGVSPTLASSQDVWVPGVTITRGNSGGGLYNIAQQTDFVRANSPIGTLWAFPFNNPGQTVAAWNWKELTFAVWTDAYGANSAGGPPGTIGQPSVAYVVADELYLDVRLTGWTVRAGGGFSYERATGPATGDYNADGLVNGADYTLWSEQYASVDTRPDGNDDGAIDAADYTVWRDAQAAAAIAVPEAASATLTAALFVGVCARSVAAARAFRTRNERPAGR